MAEFQVRSQQVRQKANDLENANSQFRQKISGMEEQEMVLNNSWEGEANTNFHNAFTQNVAKWREFAGEIDKYVQALRQIADQYDKAEAQNAEIAKKRGR